ncbi:MAG: hypothetical protein ACI87W_002911 [Halieaceae bacterium]|jgi:hypothetical protein
MRLVPGPGSKPGLMRVAQQNTRAGLRGIGAQGQGVTAPVQIAKWHGRIFQRVFRGFQEGLGGHSGCGAHSIRAANVQQGIAESTLIRTAMIL